MTGVLKCAKNARQRHEYCFDQAAHAVPFSEMYVSVCMYLCGYDLMLSELLGDCFSYHLPFSPLP